MAKISLHPTDIAELLKRHPEVELEIKEKAASQVADALSREQIQSKIEERIFYNIQNLANNIIIDKNGNTTYKTVLTDSMKSLILREVRSTISSSLNSEIGNTINDLISKEVKTIVPEIVLSLRKELKKNIRSILRDELTQLLLTSS